MDLNHVYIWLANFLTCFILIYYIFTFDIKNKRYNTDLSKKKSFIFARITQLNEFFSIPPPVICSPSSFKASFLKFLYPPIMFFLFIIFLMICFS